MSVRRQSAITSPHTDQTQPPPARSQQFLAVSHILYALCEEPEIGVLELARKVGISVGTAQRITAALAGTGLLAWSPYTRKYSLGDGVLRLGNAYAHKGSQQLQRCLLEIERLSKVTRETAAVHRRVGRHRVILAQVEGSHDLCWRSEIGRPYPLHAGAASKALLAFIPPLQLDELLQDHIFEAYQPATPRTRDALNADLETVRRIGVAVSFGERATGAGGVAAPVIDAAGLCEYALSIYGPEHRIRPLVDELIQTVRQAAARVSSSAISDEGAIP